MLFQVKGYDLITNICTLNLRKQSFSSCRSTSPTATRLKSMWQQNYQTITGLIIAVPTCTSNPLAQEYHIRLK